MDRRDGALQCASGRSFALRGKRAGWWLSAGLALSAACGADADPDEVTASKCQKLREHVIGLRLDAARTPDAVRAQHAAGLRAALGDNDGQTCMRETTSSQLKCTLAAKTFDAARACSESLGGEPGSVAQSQSTGVAP